MRRPADGPAGNPPAPPWNSTTPPQLIVKGHLHDPNSYFFDLGPRDGVKAQGQPEDGLEDKSPTDPVNA